MDEVDRCPKGWTGVERVGPNSESQLFAGPRFHSTPKNPKYGLERYTSLGLLQNLERVWTVDSQLFPRVSD